MVGILAEILALLSPWTTAYANSPAEALLSLSGPDAGRWVSCVHTTGALVRRVLRKVNAVMSGFTRALSLGGRKNVSRQGS